MSFEEDEIKKWRLNEMLNKRVRTRSNNEVGFDIVSPMVTGAFYPGRTYVCDSMYDGKYHFKEEGGDKQMLYIKQTEFEKIKQQLEIF